MTATTDQSALLAAIVADPTDDTVRLVFADAVEECGDSELANFIRGQIVLAHNPDLMHCVAASATWCPVCGDCCCRNLEESRSDGDCPLHAPHSPHDFVTEEERLLPALRARLMPRCPGCSGTGTERYTDSAGDMDDRGCSMCCPEADRYRTSGSGICPGTLVRGMPVLSVPLVAVGREVDKPLYCTEAELVPSFRHEGAWTHRSCGKCKNCKAVTNRVFQATTWAIAAKARGASFRPSDKETYANGAGPVWYRLGRDVPSELVPTSAELPGVVWDALDGHSTEFGGNRWKAYPTESAALLALERAATSLVPATTPED